MKPPKKIKSKPPKLRSRHMGVKVEKDKRESLWDLAGEIHEEVQTWDKEKQDCVDFDDDKFDILTIELLTHKYHYYMKDDPIISDYDYDKLERKWIDLGKQLGIDMDNYPNWIGFDENHPLAKDIKK